LKASPKLAGKVYAYDLVITNHQGHTRRTRDAYSFLPTLGESDLFLFGKGDERKIYDKLGAQLRTIDGVPGTSFAVWAPNAQRVSVVGDFNNWDGRFHPMRLLGASGVWEIFIPGVGVGAHYKFEIRDAHGNIKLNTDPFGFFFEVAPKQAAIVWDTKKFKWNDAAWLKQRRERDALRSPMSVYEVHVGSWQKKSATESWSYRELAEAARRIRQAPRLHARRIFARGRARVLSVVGLSGHRLLRADQPLRHAGRFPVSRQRAARGRHRRDRGLGAGAFSARRPGRWPNSTARRCSSTRTRAKARIRTGARSSFNFGRNEVSNFLVANALFWCERFHIDGLRVDAVASMLYLDYSRKEGEWIPNQFGGRENLEAIEFLKKFNHITHTEFPGVMTIAEESTAWPLVTRPPYLGGLGFSFKWNMGWMHDTLGYFKHEPVHRKYHQNDLTFAMLYHFNENFILPLSHDEVVHGKGSLIGRMPGDDWQKFANLRALFAYQWLFPGKKLLFMGGEFGQRAEWNENAQLDWWLLDAGPFHRGLQKFVEDLNKLYAATPALWQADYDHAGFSWIDCNDRENSILSFMRQTADGSNHRLPSS
jgi:1,4-alpha-glucan branching enzyme